MKETDANISESDTSRLPSGDPNNGHPVKTTSGDTPAKKDPDESRVGETEQRSPQDRELERAQTAHDEEPSAQGQSLAAVSTAGPVHSVFTKNQKRFIVVMASFGGFFSPVSANIYFPALNALAKDLGVTSTLINLTLTSYMIFQGLAPSVIGSLADSAGRRPAYTICFIIYIGANIGLALQNQYAALFVLRCIQSSGSSGTIALSSGIVSDIATVSERGKYLGFITAGSLLGPSIGPVVGGILAQFLGWRAIFWFLVILAVAFLVPFVILFPETGIPPFQYLWRNCPRLTTEPARTAVGNGSIPPQGWNMSLINYLALRRARKANPSNNLTRTQSRNSLRRPRRKPFNPLASVQLLGDLETAILLLYNAFLFAGFYDVTASLPSLYAQIYGFNSLQIGLCYIPFGVGCCCAALSNGQLLDRNFLRWARKLDVEIKKGRQTDLKNFPIEKVRLQVALPMLYVSCVLMLIYGWILEVDGPLAPALVLLFFFSFTVTAAFNVISTLLIDFYPRAPATATATNNLLRCLLGAGATGVITPMIDTMGRGWCFTFLSLFLVASSPMLWAIYFRGMGWREQRRIKSERKETEYEKKQAARVEEGNISRDGIETEKTTVRPVEGGETETRAVVEEESEKGEAEDGIRHKLSRNFSHDSAF